MAKGKGNHSPRNKTRWNRTDDPIIRLAALTTPVLDIAVASGIDRAGGASFSPVHGWHVASPGLVGLVGPFGDFVIQCFSG